MRIEIDDLSGTKIAEFLAAHLEQMKSISPPESVHALDLDALRSPDVTFWTVMDGDVLAGCGALKTIDAGHAEIKSMRTAPEYTNRGIATTLLRHIIDEAEKRGLSRLSLETGSFDFFAPARGLYKKFGFEYCDPFAGYETDPNSVHMTKVLQRVDAGCQQLVPGYPIDVTSDCSDESVHRDRDLQYQSSHGTGALDRGGREAGC